MNEQTAPPSSHRSVAPWLGDGDVLVHIGVHKTGTTAVQSALAAARPRLRAQNVCYPGQGTEHFVATNAFFGRRRGSNWTRPMQAPSRSQWTGLMNEVARADGQRVVLSSEALCECRPDQIRAFLDEFGDRRVRILVTLRPLEVLLPSNWQQYVKVGNTFAFDEWLRPTMADPIEPKLPTPSFWMRNDHPSVLRRWADALGDEHIAALVVDPGDRSMLFRTFEEIIGLETGTLTAAPTAASNRGLSAEEAEFLRQFNVSLDRGMDFRHYHGLIRRAGLLEMVEQRSPGPDEHTIALPAWAVERAREIGVSHVERIRSMGVKVFGDLEHLVPTTPITDVGPSTALPTTVPIDAAVAILRGTLIRSVERIEHLEGVTPSIGTAANAKPPSGVARVRHWVPPALIPFALRVRSRLLRRH